MDEELLINLVRDYAELYDVEHKLYEDSRRREAAWHEISKKIMVPAHECKDRWKRLRDNYRRAKKLRGLKKRQGAAKIKPIKHEKILCFLDSIMENRSARNNFTDDTEAGSSIMFHDKQESVSDTVSLEMDPLPVLERTYSDDSTVKSDTVVSFFTNLGETVKTFPEAVQIRVKRDIFKIINDTEEEILLMRRNGSKLANCVISGCDVSSFLGDEK